MIDVTDVFICSCMQHAVMTLGGFTPPKVTAPMIDHTKCVRE